MHVSVLKMSVVSLVHRLSRYTVNCDQGRQHGHWLAASICLCKEQKCFFITAPPHMMILYLKCQESPFTDLIQRRLNSLRHLPKVNEFVWCEFV